jgi:hypothetical protein
VFLNGSTVLDDAVPDVLTGNAGRDWFLVNRDGSLLVRDIITNLQSNETVTNVS